MILLSSLGGRRITRGRDKGQWRDDSYDLAKLLGPLACPLPIRPDMVFSGKWVGGETVSVAGERKKVQDCCNSINDGSLVHKFQMTREEGHRFQFLIIEGLKRKGASGLLEVRRGKAWVPLLPEMTYRKFRSFLHQCYWYMGVQVIETATTKQTAEELRELYLMWQTAPEDHGSLQAFNSEDRLPDVGLWTRPSLLRRMVKELDGVGWKRSQAVDVAAEGSVEQVVDWSVKDWEQVEGIGKKGAESIWRQLHT